MFSKWWSFLWAVVKSKLELGQSYGGEFRMVGDETKPSDKEVK